MEIKNLDVEAEGKRILRGINLKIGKGERHVLMGTNASGKTTLALTIMGFPPYRITRGQITFGGKLLNNLQIDERAKLGIALTFQSPLKVDLNFAQFISEIETKFGSSLEPIGNYTFSSTSKRLKGGLRRGRREAPLCSRGGNSPPEYFGGRHRGCKPPLESSPKGERLAIELSSWKTEFDEEVNYFKDRNLNDGLSGGEKKRSELMQVLAMRPKFIILDEIDSGVDVDSLKLIGKILDARGESMLIITHYRHILNHLRVDKVHLLGLGKILVSGNPDKVLDGLEKYGHHGYLEKLGICKECPLKECVLIK